MLYLRRLVELALAAFIAAATPVLYTQGLTKAGLAGAAAAGGMAVYGLIVKGLGGDRQRPTIQ